MEKQTKKWWLLTTEQEEIVEVSDDYYNHGRLFETTVPFWGTREDLMRYVTNKWFTKRETILLGKGWQAFEKLAIIFRGSQREPNWKWVGTFKKQNNASKGWYYGWLKEDKISIEERKCAPWLKHDVLVDLQGAKICLRFECGHDRRSGDAPWTKTLKITCLDQNGHINHALAVNMIASIGRFVAGLQNTIK